jgi:hypothetical protein
MSAAEEPEHLRVLIANQRAGRLERVAGTVVSLGHEVIARSIEVRIVSKTSHACLTASRRDSRGEVGRLARCHPNQVG